VGKQIPWTFKTWIAKFKNVDLPIGDLAAYIENASDFPLSDEDDDDLSTLTEYFVEKNSRTEPILEIFILAWNYYQVSC